MDRHCYGVVKQKLAFLLIPKTGATSIKQAIKLHPEATYPQDLQNRGVFVAAFVRNPYDRLLSAWADKTVRPTPGLEAIGVYEGMPFPEFVRVAAARGELDHHLRPQCDFLFKKGRLGVDFIGRFERLQEDWGRLQKMFALNDLPHANKSSNPGMQLYDRFTRSVVRKAYKKDFRLLGYRE